MARQYLVPNWGYINETGNQQYLIPGFGYLNETAVNDVTAVGSVSGHGTISGVGASLGKGTGSSAGHATVQGIAPSPSVSHITGTASVTGVGASKDASTGHIAGTSSVAGAAQVVPQTTGFLIPAMGCLNPRSPSQYFVPNWGFINETQQIGSAGHAAGTSSVKAVAAPSTAHIQGAATVSCAGASVAASHGSVNSHSSISGAGTFGFYSIVQYTNCDDLFNIISFAPYQPASALATAAGYATVTGAGGAKDAARATVTGHSSVSAVGRQASGSGQLDFSNQNNSALSAGLI